MVGVPFHNLLASGLVPSALKVAPPPSSDCRFFFWARPLLLLPWSCGADASVLGRCGGVLSLAVVDSGAVVVDWAFVWCEWCRLVVVAVCELLKSVRANGGT